MCVCTCARSHSSCATASTNAALGDALVIGGSLLYAVSNVGEEHVVKSKSAAEYLACVGTFAMLVSVVQAGALEGRTLVHMAWPWEVVVLIAGFALALFLFSILVPHVIVASNATFLNLGLLTADFFTAAVAALVFAQTFAPLYILAFVTIVLALFVYHMTFHQHHQRGPHASASASRMVSAAEDGFSWAPAVADTSARADADGATGDDGRHASAGASVGAGAETHAIAGASASAGIAHERQRLLGPTCAPPPAASVRGCGGGHGVDSHSRDHRHGVHVEKHLGRGTAGPHDGKRHSEGYAHAHVHAPAHDCADEHKNGNGDGYVPSVDGDAGGAERDMLVFRHSIS